MQQTAKFNAAEHHVMSLHVIKPYHLSKKICPKNDLKQPLKTTQPSHPSVNRRKDYRENSDETGTLRDAVVSQSQCKPVPLSGLG